MPDITKLLTTKISSASWADAYKTMIKASINNQNTHAPNDLNNADRKAIAEWELAGNTILPYMPR